ncbi:C1 family peptidase [Actinocrispum sp. NPDC049592]|uniref:C1 family peptidase n=1 Tax=Actinocrispum sp. NPDC049592 TaxID=3154835 RepID=UPI00341ADC9A
MPETPEALNLDILRDALSDAGGPWESGTTTMSLMEEHERTIRLGVPARPELPAHDTALLTAATAVDDVTAPSSFDLRNVGGVNYDTAVKDQGGCGSCVAFGTAATMENVYRFTHRTQTPLDLSEAHLFYCHARAEGRNCGNGWWPDRALTAARDKGVAFDDYFPYTAGDQDCSRLNADWPNRNAKVTSFETISGNVAKMKESISTYGAITACFNVFQDFFSYRTGVYRHVTGNLAGGHCVCLIGYDDAAGCWIARNSWGTGWGDSGYFRIAYGECGIETFQTCAAYGVNIRAWLPDQQILGLWSNEYDANIWAYGSTRGWIKLDSTVAVTSQTMLSELAAAKALNRPVGLFEDTDSIKQIYAW